MLYYYNVLGCWCTVGAISIALARTNRIELINTLCTNSTQTVNIQRHFDPKGPVITIILRDLIKVMVDDQKSKEKRKGLHPHGYAQTTKRKECHCIQLSEYISYQF